MPPKSVADLSARWEPLVDDWLIEEANGAALRLHPPTRREVALAFDRPWEGPASAYVTAMRVGSVTRLYYRGNLVGKDHSEGQVTCLAESSDGIHFTRPEYGLFEFEGSKANNIVWTGPMSHNFTPFLDTNPACAADARFKAVGSKGKELFGFASPDGIRWRPLREQPFDMPGAFDSQNLVFYDELMGCYRCFSRCFQPLPDGRRTRAIQSCTSPDFVQWTPPQLHCYAEGVPFEQFYTNATVPCPGAEHILLSFPKRFVTERTKVPWHGKNGISDPVFMTSRDGVSWERPFLGSWLRPDIGERHWTQRGNMPAWGIVPAGETDLAMYISEHYQWDSARLRRLTIRRLGFAAMAAGPAGGEFVTRPLRFTGNRLLLNYATSAVGSVQVEMQEESGRPIPGLALADMEPLFGNELAATATWRTTRDLAATAGRPVRLRFALKDADLFALKIGALETAETA